MFERGGEKRAVSFQQYPSSPAGATRAGGTPRENDDPPSARTEDARAGRDSQPRDRPAPMGRLVGKHQARKPLPGRRGIGRRSQSLDLPAFGDDADVALLLVLDVGSCMVSAMKRVVFMGSADFAVPSLRALVTAGYDVALVVTRADKPKGRGRILSETPVKQEARILGLPVFQPLTLRKPEVVETLREARPDLIVVAAYGRILPPEVLALPPRLPSGHYGCINIHGSLLPKYRGAAPIQWAILNGEAETGVTIMVMDEGMDTGPIAAQRAIPISPDDTAGSLTHVLAPLGADLLIETLPALLGGSLTPRPQQDALASFAPILKKEDGLVDWSRSSAMISNQVRGLDPWPGAFTTLPGTLRLRIFPPVRVVHGVPAGVPGEVLDVQRDGMTVRTGDGGVLLQKVQPEGRRPMTPWELLAGRWIARGDVLGGSPTHREVSS